MPQLLHEGLLLDGRYRLKSPLGEGGMGSVWVAEQIALRRDVAVKMLLRAPSGDDRDRLRMEALALAAVRHPSVVQVFDYGETPEGVPYVVMELIGGILLSERLHRSGPYDAVMAVTLILPLLEGLHAAHRAGVVHRDIKPSNVVLAPSPDGGVGLKLLDFGIARLDEARASPLTVAGSIVGTPESMAPEQVRGHATDGRTDVWGAGLLLYAMIAGQNPFLASDMLATMRRVAEEPPAYPTRAVGLDGRLWALLMGSLRKDPVDRPPSAEALRVSLLAWLASRGTPSITPTSTAPPATGLPWHAVSTLPAPPNPVTDDARARTLPSLPYAAPGEAPPSLDDLVRTRFKGS